jgi:rhomboid protease GluP
VINLNHILLFIAIASSVILLARLKSLRSADASGWRIAAIVVLVVTSASYFFLPAAAGIIGGIFWALLLLFPAVAEKRIALLLLEKRYGAARRLALVRRGLHPWNNSTQLPRLLLCLQLARDDRLAAALDELAKLRSEKTAPGRSATAFIYALTENWPGLVDWCRRDLSVTKDPAIRALYLRGLGEIGALDDLAWTFAARSQSLSPRLTTMSPQAAQEFVFLLAFSGRTNEVVKQFRGPLAALDRDHQEFWIATSELAEGKTGAAVARLTQLRTRDAILKRAIDRRLATAQNFPAPRLSAASDKLLARLSTESAALTSQPSLPPARGAPAVWALILLNVGMFAVEMIAGGSTNPVTLHRLGALEPDAILVRHEYGRLVTALFMHYGFLHIAVNLYALYLLGPALEAMIGSWKFVIGYLLSGIGSSLGVVVLSILGLTSADQLVGASGCVMGVIGISAGLLVRHRRSPLVGGRLREILVIVVFQTLFDLWTPQVSLGAHLSGFLTGVVIGIVFAASERPI